MYVHHIHTWDEILNLFQCAIGKHLLRIKNIPIFGRNQTKLRFFNFFILYLFRITFCLCPEKNIFIECRTVPYNRCASTTYLKNNLVRLIHIKGYIDFYTNYTVSNSRKGFQDWQLQRSFKTIYFRHKISLDYLPIKIY